VISRTRSALIAGSIAAAAALGSAAPASATPSVTSLELTAPAELPRSSTSSVSVTVQTTEAAQFTLSVSAADVATSFGLVCTVLDPCTFNPATGVVTVHSDADGIPEEPMTLTLGGVRLTPSAIPLVSSEGQSPPASPRVVTAQAIPTGGTIGAGNDTATTAIVSNPDSDTEIQLTTTGPAAGRSAPRGAGSSVIYTATLTKVGRLSFYTDVQVSLVPDIAMGTSPGPSQMVTFDGFPAEETTKMVSIPVSVPAGATLGSASYHFVVEYDGPVLDTIDTIDTETGTTRGFTVVPGADLDLSTTTPSQTVFTDQPAHVDVTLLNNGPDTASRAAGATGPGVSFELQSSGPGSAEFSPAAAFLPGPGGSCTVAPAGVEVICDLLNPLPSGSSATMRLPVVSSGETTATVGLVDLFSDVGDATTPG